MIWHNTQLVFLFMHFIILLFYYFCKIHICHIPHLQYHSFNLFWYILSYIFILVHFFIHILIFLYCLAKNCCIFYIFLLEALHIFCFSASCIKRSRKSGCAKEMSISARSHVLLPDRLTIPYSVTI